MNGVITPQIWQIAVAYVFVVILLIIVRKRGISREKEILIATVRMTLQLILAGYILLFLFDNVHVGFTVGTVILMETFAIFNTIRQVKTKLSASLKKDYRRFHGDRDAFQPCVLYRRGAGRGTMV